MNPATLRTIFIVFLLAHGWMHFSLAQVPVPQPGGLHTPFMPSWWRDAVDPTWPISRLGLAPQAARVVGWALWLLVAAVFTLAAVALLAAPAQANLWQGLAAAGSLLSLLLLALYWHAWYPVGALIDLALLAAITLHAPMLRFA